MPDIDEDVLRELMRRSTDDVHAPSAVTAGIISHHRRRRTRARVLGVASAGAAAGLVAGVTVANSGNAHSGGNAAPALPAIRLTAAQHVLYKLSKEAASTPRQTGRYVALREEQTNNGDGVMQSSEVVSVIDARTGAGVTYQDWAKVPGAPKPPTKLTEPAGSSPTQAQYDAMPTSTAALRAFLLAQAEKQQAQIAKPGSAGKHIQITSDDLVFQQATNLLWSPLLSPALRAAVYKVLAATPGVVVKQGVTDSDGRPAIEISRADTTDTAVYATFENPSTGATLETLVTVPYKGAAQGGGGYYRDMYQTVTYSSAIPPNPYGN